MIEANQVNICYPEQSEKFYTRYDMTWSNLNYFRPPSEKFPYAVYITWLSVKFKHTAEHCVTYKYMKRERETDRDVQYGAVQYTTVP